MKKLLRVFVLALVLCAAMAVTACAASFTSAADSLYEMGLFKGSDIGYELDRAPSRAEAAVMLVRLLGQEETALAMEYTAPFTDVPAWAQPYVSYLYENGLTNGVSATQYAPASLCTAQSYATFLLRALGYDDITRGDFSWDSALDFAAEKAVLDYINYDPDSFLRDHMVAMSFTALSRPTADGKYDTLLDQLVASGAVDSAKAADILIFFDACVKCDAAGAVPDDSFAATSNMSTTYTQGSLSFTTNTTVDTKVILDKQNIDNTRREMITTVSMLGESYTTREYYVNGTYYYSDGETSYKMPMSLEEAMEGIYSGMDISDGGTSAVTPVTCYTVGTPVGRGDGLTSYAFQYSDKMLDLLSADSQDAVINDVSLILAWDQDGALVSERMTIDVTVTSGGETVQTVTTMTMTITATGSDVVITLPADLNTYPEVDPEDLV